MIFVDVNKERWMEKYALEEGSYKCTSCDKVFKTTVPVMTQECAGLASPVHECGAGYVGYVLTPRTKDGEDFWTTVLS